MTTESEQPDTIEAEAVNIKDGGAAVIKGNTVDIKDGGAALIVGDTLNIRDGGAMVIVANRAVLNDSGALFLLAKEVCGNGRIIFDVKAAVLFGVIVGVIMSLTRVIFCRRNS
jgi:uncharacterized protein YodC (DUF2158 family)